MDPALIAQPDTTGLRPEDLSFLREGGDAGKALREVAWEETPLGKPQHWSPALKSIVRFMLTTRHPVFVFWGADHVCLHNDGYVEFLDPASGEVLGRPGRDAWKSTWGMIGPLVDAVMRDGKSWAENDARSIDNDDLKAAHWQYRYQPVPDPTSVLGVGGVLVV